MGNWITGASVRLVPFPRRMLSNADAPHRQSLTQIPHCCISGNTTYQAELSRALPLILILEVLRAAHSLVLSISREAQANAKKCGGKSVSQDDEELVLKLTLNHIAQCVSAGVLHKNGSQNVAFSVLPPRTEGNEASLKQASVR